MVFLFTGSLSFPKFKKKIKYNYVDLCEKNICFPIKFYRGRYVNSAKSLVRILISKPNI